MYRHGLRIWDSEKIWFYVHVQAYYFPGLLNQLAKLNAKYGDLEIDHTLSIPLEKNLWGSQGKRADQYPVGKAGLVYFTGSL